MRILVCGGRDFYNEIFVYKTLDKYPECTTIISGEAQGADRLAKKYADESELLYHGFSADWKKYGRSAGPIRNKQMLTEGKPDLVIAFPGGRGTANMVALAKEASVPVIEYSLEDVKNYFNIKG